MTISPVQQNLPDTPLRVGVIGCGAMGRNHVRILNELKGVELAGVADTSAKARTAIQSLYASPSFSDYQELDGIADAVTIATPTPLHAEIAEFFLARGIPCLIEKPMALAVTDCHRLIKAADQAKVPVLIGHTERFNPALIQLESMVKKLGNFRVLDIRRLSYASQRISDTDVIFDLMIHDIDITLALLGSDTVEHINATGYWLNNNGPDHVVATLRSAKGRVVTLTASRITPNKLRELHVLAGDAHIVMDFIDQEILLYRQGRISVTDSGDSPHYNIELAVEKAVVRHGEPLTNELRHFLDCVRKKSEPLISPRFALRAVELAYQIKEIASGTSARQHTNGEKSPVSP